MGGETRIPAASALLPPLPPGEGRGEGEPPHAPTRETTSRRRNLWLPLSRPRRRGHPLPVGEGTGSAPVFAEGVADDTNGQTLAPARAAALLPADLLQPGELIILLLKPSPWYILLAPLGSLAAMTILILAAMVLTARLQVQIGHRDLFLLWVALVGARLFWQFLDWLGRIFVLTDRRVVRVKGVLRINVFETPLRNIQHTYALFSLRERFLGLGTIAFATSGTAFIECAWDMVARPLAVHREVVRALGRYR